ncbi:MAG: UbiD family decarboxylase [Phycisphaerales bacterium]|nr:UbiD family decarboxylase [Phycisphaerales bacterium]
MYPDLASFVAALERAGELVRIRTKVSPVLEIAEITDRVSKARAPSLPSHSAQRNDPRFFDRGGPALLFDNVAGSDFPVLINAFGSYRRMEMALGCETRTASHTTGSQPNQLAAGGFQPPIFDGFESIASRIASLVKPQPPRSLSEAFDKLRLFAPLARVGPKRLKTRGPCQEVIRTGSDIDLTRIPLLRCWPLDGDFASLGYPADANAQSAARHDMDEQTWNAHFRGRFVTLAGVHSVHADDRDTRAPSSHNIGMYRMQLLARDRLAMHWHMHHDGAAHWRSWKTLGRPMPVAIALGGSSIMPYAATCPLPPGISELLMAGFLQGHGVRLCRAATVPIWVPADSDIIIEGYVRTDAGYPGWDPRRADAGALGPGAVFEGPFGDHTGFYSMPDRYPVMEVTAVTHRRNAIYPTTIVGLPPQEDYYLGKATERIMLPLLRMVAPDIEDYDLPMFGAFHNAAFVQIHKAFPLHARRAINAVWGAGQMAWTKIIFVVDHDVDVHDTPAVLRAATEHADPSRDLIQQVGALDILDHAAPWLAAGGKLAFDCTVKLPDESIDSRPRTPRVLPDDADLARWSSVLADVPGVEKAACPPLLRGWAFLSTGLTGSHAVRNLLNRVTEALRASTMPPPAFVLALGSDADPANVDQAMFRLGANADFARDMRIVEVRGRHVALFDATPKPVDDGYPLPVRAWPPILEMDHSTRELVTRRWNDYGLPAT